MSRYATTDLHGCLHTFRRLVEEKLRLTRQDELYLLGDYVNKGPDSRGVLDYLMQLQAAGYHVRCLRGNTTKPCLTPPGTAGVGTGWVPAVVCPRCAVLAYHASPTFRRTT